jgi:hypothetical protein
MIIKDAHFHKLHETDKFIVGYVFEYAYLISKKNHKEIYMGDFYGDPTCGLIGADNTWCLVGGATLNLWREGENILEIEDDDLNWIYKIRQTAPHEVELLIDPWSEKAYIWYLNIQTLVRHKIRNYTSVMSLNNCRIKSFESYPCIVISELPID